MANKPTSTSRLKQDYLRLKRDPVPYISAEPLTSNILEWHYVIKGPEDTPFYGGYFHGSLIFTKEFPFKPPSIYIHTPNGRFKPNKRLCLSISDFHPDSWNPAWSVATILTGLLSIMLENSPLLGSCESTTYEKRKLAHLSLEFNLKNETFRELFPELVTEIQEKVDRINEMKKQNELNKVADSNKNEASTTERPTGNENQLLNNAYSNVITNLIIFAGLAVFAFIVNYIFKTINIE